MITKESAEAFYNLCKDSADDLHREMEWLGEAPHRAAADVLHVFNSTMAQAASLTATLRSFAQNCPAQYGRLVAAESRRKGKTGENAEEAAANPSAMAH